VRSGVFLVLLALAAPGCNNADGGGETLVLDSGEVQVDGVVHEVAVGGAGARDSLAPATLGIHPGDAVRFVNRDRRPHALAFIADSLAAPIREYLERTRQLRGPPLVSEGAAWIVVLEEAPPGRYPFHCRSHDAAGVLIVSPEE
jgi:plastocyanin